MEVKNRKEDGESMKDERHTVTDSTWDKTEGYRSSAVLDLFVGHNLLLSLQDYEEDFEEFDEDRQEEEGEEKEEEEVREDKTSVDSESHSRKSRAYGKVIDFSAARQREINQQASDKQKKRSVELLRLIDLDFSVTECLLDLPPAYVQCNEDNMERDTQTDETDITDMWTQHPPESSVACGGPQVSQNASDEPVTRTTVDSKRLAAFLRSATQVQSCCFSPGKATLVFAGTDIGSVLVWDLREHSGSHLHIRVCEEKWTLRHPTFSTDAVLSGVGHFSPIVSVEPVLVNVGAGLRDPLLPEQEESLGLSFQLGSLDETGLLNLWVVVELPKADYSGSQTDLGLHPGGKVKLLHSSSLQTTPGVDKRILGVTSHLSFILKFLPSDSNHYFIGSNMEVTFMSCGVEEDGFLSLHRGGRVRFYTADGYLREPFARSTVPYEGVSFTQIAGRLVGWGPEGSRELVTAGAGNVCVWSLSHMVCRVRVVDGFERNCVFTQLALVLAAAQKAPLALAVCGRSVTVVDLREGCVLEHKTKLHQRYASLVYCPLQDVVVTASKDASMRVWGSEWELLMSFCGHTAAVTSLLLCPMSGLLLSSSLDSTLRYWNLQTGDQVKTVTPPTGSAPPLSVGGPSSTSTFFSFSKAGIDFWTFNSLYELHCKLGGDSAHNPVCQILAKPSGPNYPVRTVCVRGDSGVMLMAAGTGAVLTVFQPEGKVRCADYCLYKEMLMVLTDEGAVIKASTLTNPVTQLETWTNGESGWGDACCMALYSHIADEETALEEWMELQQERGEKPRARKQLDQGKNRFLVMLGLHTGHIPDEDPFDLHASLFPPKPPELRPLTPPTLREGFFPNWSLAKKPDSTHITQEGVPSRPTTASLGFVPNSVLVSQIWPEDVLENAVPSRPWTLREQHTHDTEQEEERKADHVLCLDEDEDDDFNMNSVLHLIETSPEPESPTPPPHVTPPPESQSTEKPKYTLKPLKPLPPIKTLPPPPTPTASPTLAPPPPIHTPTPVLPNFLNQFLQEEWFHSLYPEPGCIPESLSLAEFCAQLLDFLKRYTEQRFVIELLNFLVFVNPYSYDITVEILLLLADRELRLQGVAVCMLQALGVDDAQQWLHPQLESWGREAQKHTEPLRRLRELARHWLDSWTAKYKIFKSSGKKSALSSLVSPSDVLRYFCWVQKESKDKPPSESEGRKDTVVQETHPYRWKAVHRLGETNSMTRVREPQGLWLPPLISRPPLSGFTRLLCLPLPRVTASSFPFSLEARCLKEMPPHRYFLLERSYVQFYR
ncbi:hypothetical protein Q7C36_004218 [Tachysurus vachellii]|uniref:WD repeat-containing protein 97 n=1 Tax=Tachysurus vachellii TaxID=175792 RepID=A0AA88NP01_TACVA|nr:hypothetical protein Q7C36_004218 [Tachysurus vachellii]